MLCCSCVSSGKVGVKQTLGQFVGIQEPGCALYCVPFQMVTSVSLAVQQLQCSSDCKTKDNVTVTVQTAIQFRVQKENVEQAVFHVANPQAMMRAEVDNILRSTLPQLTLDESYEAKEQMVGDIRKTVKAAMGKYGYEILNALVTDLQPERTVLAAMNEINAARRMRDAAVEKGEADKVMKIKAAEGEAEAKRLAGMGMAQMRSQMAKGFKDSMTVMKASGMSEQDAMHMMIMTQYLDTLKDFAGSHTSIVVPHGPSGGQNVSDQIRQGLLTSQSVSPKPAQQQMTGRK